MKLVSYALFPGPAEHFERMAYIRGFYFNARMNTFLYPEWTTHLEIDARLYGEFKDLFDWLVDKGGVDLSVNDDAPALCEGMLWRMKPVWTTGVSHVLCRDCDAISTHREARCVRQWLESGLAAHAINDNPMHGGLMGGMVGFETAGLRALVGHSSWTQMIEGYDLSRRGSDQHLLNQRLGAAIASSTMLHRIQGAGLPAAVVVDEIPDIRLPGVHPELWQSDLVCRHIGSAGVIDLEVLRFFRRFDANDSRFHPIERQFPQLFYWHR